MNEFQEYTDLAVRVLEGDTNYIRDKKIIFDIFKMSRRDRFETIVFRLTIIDSYYSTQMNKRFFGIDDLANALAEITLDDEDLRNLCLEFISYPLRPNKIQNLFNQQYGIRKTGHPAGQAASLISKYLYFLTEYKFPIYDNLVRISYPLIAKKYPVFNLDALDKAFDISFFGKINRLNVSSNTNDFNKIDNFLWLIGKLKEGSLSLILDKERYLKLVQRMRIQKGTDSSEVDKSTRIFISKNIDKLSDIFNEGEVKFLKFCDTL